MSTEPSVTISVEAAAANGEMSAADAEKSAEKGETTSRPRGFAAMTSDRQRQIASLGGRTAHERGQAHQFSSEEARQAGRKGGQTVSRDRDYMVAIGRRGGNKRSINMQTRPKADDLTPAPV